MARSVAERLGFRLVDDEVIAEAAEWTGLDPAFIADAERRKGLMARLLGGIADQSGTTRLPTGDAGRGLPSERDLRGIITSAVTSFAREGSVVIVAHAASFAVSGDDVLRVLVTASPETRATRVAAERGISEREAARLLGDEDAGRADYLKRFYGVERELPTQFDLVVNTDSLSATAAADAVIAAAGSGA